MNNIKKKKIWIGILSIVGILSITIGVSIAFFNYTRTGDANTIKVGRISFVTRQTKTISLTNLFPIDPTNSEEMSDETKVGTMEIEIEGDTDYNKGVEYLVSSTNTHITTSTGKLVPISLEVTPTNLGTSSNNYFTAREDKNATIYKKLVGDTLVGNQMLLVGFIKPNTTSGTIEGVNGKITIKAYLDENKILISDTYDGTESDNMGTPNSLAQGKTVLTTTEWNALSSSGISFQIKVEANEGIWVKGSLEEIMKTNNIGKDTENGVDFSKTSDQDGTLGVYMRAGTENDAYPIVYYRGAVEDNNVVFNNKCWKAVRTTDTGGVKLIYNGELSPVYTKEFTDPDTYTSENEGGILTFDNTDNTWNYEVSDGSNREISFKVPAGDNYSIVATGTTGSTCGGGLGIYKDGVQVNGTSQGGGNPINYSYTYGTLSSSNVLKIIVNGTNSSTCGITVKMYMQQGTTKLSKNDYSVLMQKNSGESGCDNTGTDTHINMSGTNMFAFNTNSTSPAYVGYMYGTVYERKQKQTTATMKFGSGFTYSGGTYTLTNAEDGIANTRHYTCFTTNDTCDGADVGKVYYVYNKTGNYYYYIELENGKSVEDAMAEMQTNTTSSNAKIQIESWYASNMASVTNKLEDTIWCNDRSIERYNGWSVTGTINETSDYKNESLLFGAFERSNYASGTSTTKNQPSLACVNKNDAFTVNNGNGNQKLTYPVALLTEDEMVLAGGVAGSGSTFYLNNVNTYYWSLSPLYFSDTNAVEFSVVNGGIDGSSVSNTSGLRPSISLKPGLPVIKGTGTVTDPYVIE